LQISADFNYVGTLGEVLGWKISSAAIALVLADNLVPTPMPLHVDASLSLYPIALATASGPSYSANRMAAHRK
jgi:hypothetical protein